MLIFLVIIGLMAGIACASYFYGKRHGASQARRSDETNTHWDDAGPGEELNDFDAGDDAD